MVPGVNKGAKTMSTTPRIYVGTYAKYNAGSIAGAWLNLDDYTDKEDFEEACRELHRGEADPEFMFQDWEGLPAGMVSESYIDEAVWEWLELEDHERETVAAYWEGVDGSEKDFGAILDAFQGCYDSQLDYAYEWVESTGMMEGWPEQAKSYFDFEAWVRDVFLEGYTSGVRHNGKLYVFSNY
jgi:antirestriction protein